MASFDFGQAYKRSAFLQFLTGTFLPDDFRWAGGNSETIAFSGEYTRRVTRLGTSLSLGLDVFEFIHASDASRTSTAQEAFRLLLRHSDKRLGLIVFVPEDKPATYCFSLVRAGTFCAGKPCRSSFLLGETRETNAAEKALATKVSGVEDLFSRFAVDAVSRDFCQNIAAWHTWAVTLARFPEGRGYHVILTRNDNEQRLIRLIMRLMFVWFIRQKRLIPSWVFDKKEMERILNNFDATSKTSGAYYNGIIQNLFFATLNKHIAERAFTNDSKSKQNPHYGIKTFYRDQKGESLFAISHAAFIDLFKTIPFINSGLFECLDNMVGGISQRYIDGFSREKDRAAFVPNALFWGDDTHDGIIPLFSRYYFTLEENTPQDIDIAITPEILGNVLENFSGTFHPSRESESLKAYLWQKLKNTGAEYSKSLDTLFSYTDAPHGFSEEQTTVLLNAIDTCKIIDPACGSGTFLMDILNKLMFILDKLDPDNKERREWYLIQRIYGVDIQPIAVEISKLRFFILFIAGQNPDKTRDNFGICPLPNLETQFAVANTHTGISKNSDKLFLLNAPLIQIKQRELLEIRHRYFNAANAKEKMLSRHSDRRIRTDISALMQEYRVISPAVAKKLREWDPYNQNIPAPFFDPSWMFCTRDGFDITRVPQTRQP
ncbi:MAG: hypothetical protein LBJ41_00415 [Treponema sp.]|jgi:hypothetical protein|nr:hypothetical protein [Treponema sp.]